jgi:hypothetical protein
MFSNRKIRHVFVAAVTLKPAVLHTAPRMAPDDVENAFSAQGECADPNSDEFVLKCVSFLHRRRRREASLRKINSSGFRG